MAVGVTGHRYTIHKMEVANGIHVGTTHTVLTLVLRHDGSRLRVGREHTRQTISMARHGNVMVTSPAVLTSTLNVFLHV